MWIIVMYIILGVFALTGLVLTIFNLPGIWLIYISVFILAFSNGFQVITPVMLLILFFVSVFSTLVDNIIIALGAKKLGGTVWGMIGAVLGGIIGLIVGNVAGMFLGPFIGATLFELIFAHKDLNKSLKAGVGSAIGVLVSIAFKIGVSIGIIVFVISRFL